MVKIGVQADPELLEVLLLLELEEEGWPELLELLEDWPDPPLDDEEELEE